MQLSDLLIYEYLEMNLKKDKQKFKTEILKATEKTITVVIPKGLKNFTIGEDVVCSVGDGKNMYILDSEIQDIIFKHPQSLVLFVPGDIIKFSEFKKERRYFTGVLAEVFKIKRFYGFVKEVSINEINLSTDSFLDTGDIIGITLFLDEAKNCLYIEGKVVRKVDSGYEVELKHINDENEKKYADFINELEHQRIEKQKFIDQLIAR